MVNKRSTHQKKVRIIRMFRASYRSRFSLASDFNNISRFLNRILGIRVQMQNILFRFFSDVLNSVVLDAKRNGSWDLGIVGQCYRSSVHRKETHFLNLQFRFGYRRRNGDSCTNTNLCFTDDSKQCTSIAGGTA